MQGSVYHLSLTNEDDGLPHPHVVVLTFSGNRDCIVVPAYSKDGYAIQQKIDYDKKSGLAESSIFVLLDNAIDVDFISPFPGKEAVWCATKSRRLSQKTVAASKRLGQMKLAAFLRVAKTLLEWGETGKSDLSPSAIKILKNLIKNLATPEEIASI